MRIPSRVGGSPWAFFPGIPDTTRIFSPGCSVKPGSMTPRSAPFFPLRAEITWSPPVLIAVAPAFSSTNHSSLTRFLSGAAWISRNAMAMSGRSPGGRGVSSDLEDLALFLGDDLVDLGDGLVGRVLDDLQPF